MKWLLLADIHGNLEALDAVLADSERRWGRLPLACAGDVVGFGPSPNECIERLAGRETLCVLGNHELMVLGHAAQPRCTPDGLAAVRWTQQHIREDARAWLAALPAVRAVGGDLVLCHGSLRDTDEYVVSARAAQAQLALLRERFPEHALLVCGHTHQPAWARDGSVRRAAAGDRVALDPSVPVLLNPGSVGLARTGPPVARYAVLDTEAGVAEFRAAGYDVGACIRKARAAGLGTLPYVPVGARWLGRARRAAGRARGLLAAHHSK
ncbi:MAG: metallophosphoesterase family protein [Armatimonadetes bacterium]|nr:metallophosphoesterase family protein [Armatimonadota bacterium]